MRKIVHLSLSVRGALLRSDAELRGVFTDDDGYQLSPLEARQNLMEMLANGVEQMRISDDCDNHCQKTGCQGHPQED